MQQEISQQMINLQSEDADVRRDAFLVLLKKTDQPVDWAYEVWNELVKNLRHKNNHVRAIAAQLLCNLVKSDPENRILQDFDQILAVTKDGRYVTARHSLQVIWKVGVPSKEHQTLLMQAMEERFRSCVEEKNTTLIRFDILQGLRNLFDEVNDENIRKTAQNWISMENDMKYRKKYLSVWKNRKKAN